MTSSTTDIGTPPKLPIKDSIKFIACVNNTHAECVRESATQKCSCLCHTAEAQAIVEEPDEIPPVDEEVDEVFDGMTGAIRTTVDGAEAIVRTDVPEQRELVNVSLDDLVHDLVVIDRKIGNEEEALESVKKRIKDLDKTREQTISEIKRRDGVPTQLGLNVD